MNSFPVVVIGGGAAGLFGAIAIKQANPALPVILLEKSEQLLSKVRISGGGRCNVTHACFDPAQLMLHYPRGGKELRGPFSRFQPRDTVQWFQDRGVELKTEADGRIFPVTDSSETIINCLLQEAKNLGVEIRQGMSVERIEKVQNHFLIQLHQLPAIHAAQVLVATGSSRAAFRWIEVLGHTVEPLVPSLFTFNVPTSPLLELSGIAVEKVHLKLLHLEQTGPLLLTHWGFSGPAVLKLSAWGAKELFDRNYAATLTINWVPELSQERVQQTLQEMRSCESTKPIGHLSPSPSLPKNLWKKFIQLCGIDEKTRYAALSNKQLQQLVEKLTKDSYQIDGKTTYKQEFVTCGGVSLSEVNFKTMESRIVPGLYFAGEVLNVDGVTGGFNFQNAWTTSWIAAQAIVS